MATKTIQIADKPTVDKVRDKVYGYDNCIFNITNRFQVATLKPSNPADNSDTLGANNFFAWSYNQHKKIEVGSSERIVVHGVMVGTTDTKSTYNLGIRLFSHKESGDMDIFKGVVTPIKASEDYGLKYRMVYFNEECPILKPVYTDISGGNKGSNYNYAYVYGHKYLSGVMLDTQFLKSNGLEERESAYACAYISKFDGYLEQTAFNSTKSFMMVTDSSDAMDNWQYTLSLIETPRSDFSTLPILHNRTGLCLDWGQPLGIQLVAKNSEVTNAKSGCKAFVIYEIVSK